MASIARFDEWRGTNGTPVLRYAAGQLEVWSSGSWVRAGLAPAVVSSTTGSPTLGTVISGGTTYRYYDFTGDGSLVFSSAGFAQIMVLGGGGGAGSWYSGGGGAGGMLEMAQAYFPVGTATVKVGAGGVGRTSGNGGAGQNGITSYVGNYYAPGGGGGGFVKSDSTPALNGGSGGGASNSNLAPGAGVVGLGHSGGSAITDQYGGGGGGAGEAGGTDGNGHGGDGRATTITGTSITLGGGGAGYSGAAGDGGGGAPGASGTVNTGGGGGSGFGDTGSGGSGRVIVRVAI